MRLVRKILDLVDYAYEVIVTSLAQFTGAAVITIGGAVAENYYHVSVPTAAWVVWTVLVVGFVPYKLVRENQAQNVAMRTERDAALSQLSQAVAAYDPNRLTGGPSAFAHRLPLPPPLPHEVPPPPSPPPSPEA